MKLIQLVILAIITAVRVGANEHYTIPFRPQNGDGPSADKSHYLPPESHTSIPYLPMRNNMNNLPYPYLPAATKAPMMFPSPFPMILSSTMMTIDDDDENENEKPQPPIQRNNRTERSRQQFVQNREQRPKPMLHQPIDRIDMKGSFGFAPHQNPVQVATPRSFIIQAEDPKSPMDQIKSGTSLGPQYLPAPGLQNVFISSTTEPAVPILRLSNEMDLDGSFSYEALGADQTHYVQHSRMENMGTDKEEQVVEGSYSYVGDNGQTYTVHYIADSNGFRASGDHLPVAPPIPEIIQRAVQYNLAEESKKPPHLRAWQDNENEISESERIQYYANSQPRNLFTGKTPEAFSFSFAQGAQSQNNIVAAASTQNPIKANVDFTPEQMKAKTNGGGAISPQITFVASQGAHVPSVNPQQTMGRMYTTERPTMPQLINYEAGLKESDQESNKALWRWQYGMNANLNQAPEKNSISRSFGEDDVMINFSDMTPDQYTKMIKSQLEPNSNTEQGSQDSQTNDNMKSSSQQQYQNMNMLSISSTTQPIVSAETNYSPSQTENWYRSINNDNHYQNQNDYSKFNSNKGDKLEHLASSHSTLVTHKKLAPPSQVVTQSYNYEKNFNENNFKRNNFNEDNFNENNFYESERIRLSTPQPVSSTDNPNIQPYYNNQNFGQIMASNEQMSSTSEMPKTTTEHDNQDIIVNESKNTLRPIQYSFSDVEARQETTTEVNKEEMFKENIFLRNLFKTDKQEQNSSNKIKEEKKPSSPKADHKPVKTPKFISVKIKPYNEIQNIKKKPLDVADILNYISAKNNFESSKLRPKNNIDFNYNQRNEMRFIPVQRNRDDMDRTEDMEYNASDLRPNYYQPEELRGIIKNYKVLHRNNSAFNNVQEAELKRNLSPPPVKTLQSSNLPPLGRAGPSMKSYLPPIYV